MKQIPHFFFRSFNRTLCCVIAFFILTFIYRNLCFFLSSFQNYSERAQQNWYVASINDVSKSNKGEVIVTLTGDQYRIPRSIELLKKRKSKLLLISGAGKYVSLKDLLNQQNSATVDIHEIWDKIILDSESQSTLGNAVECKKILSHYTVETVILATSDYHMYRAYKIFSTILSNYHIIPYPIQSDATKSLLNKEFSFSVYMKLGYEFFKLLWFEIQSIFYF